MFKVLFAVAPLALATAAFAQPAHLTDAQYVAAARCQVLMSSGALGRADAQAINALMRAESGSRSEGAVARAAEAADVARQTLRHAGAYTKTALTAERDGSCRALTGVGMVAATTPTSASRTN